MKKSALLLLIVSCFIWSLAPAQTCVRDSSLYATGDLLSPAPWTPDSMFNNLAPACPGQPYAQSITLNVPDTVVYSGITIPLNNISLATSGAINGLPPGLTYSCDPPNCVFNKLTLGCILLYGTVDDNVVPGDSTELITTVSVSSPSFPFPIPVSMPADFIPGSHYFIKYYTADQCISGTAGYNKEIYNLKNTPNPFSHQTGITFEAPVSGAYQFEVFNLLGQTVYSEKMNLTAGFTTFTFDASQIPNGTYQYSIGNGFHKATRMMVVAH